MATSGPVKFSERLAIAGLPLTDLHNLDVAAGTQLRISADDTHHASRISRFQVKTVQDLKRWVGIPVNAVGQDSHLSSHPAGFVSAAQRLNILPFPAVPLQDREMQAQLMSHLLATAPAENLTATERVAFERLNVSLVNAGAAVQIFRANDILVEKNATLIVDNSLQVLFANRIVLETGASIRMESPVARIDCTSMAQNLEISRFGETSVHKNF